MCGTADRLNPTQYDAYSWQLNAETICVVLHTD
jgi:hypothetical protein